LLLFSLALYFGFGASVKELSRKGMRMLLHSFHVSARSIAGESRLSTGQLQFFLTKIVTRKSWLASVWGQTLCESFLPLWLE
jgi:hypothetical protein